jgi:hypothetical protein
LLTDHLFHDGNKNANYALGAIPISRKYAISKFNGKLEALSYCCRRQRVSVAVVKG